MSDVEKQVPPAGEDIHLPDGSLQPLGVAVFTTIALIGITVSVVLLVIGLVGLVWVIIRWVADARREMASLPLHHSDEH